ncbi:MAG: rhodanese-related sulfurtransferase [Actinomycetales bacterium]|nr:rhodanese-related sulfurtransferase [Actinomycetales bacterium]
MELQKIILYYGFTPIEDPEAMKLWQKTLCETLGLKGRILISKHGINGTLGGDMSALKKYVRQSKEYPGFRGIDFKWSDGTGNDFPRLSVKARKEIVAFGAPDELKVDQAGVVNGGIHLRPEEVNQLVAERGDDVVFFDGRNAFEAKIGKFKNAIVPNTHTTHDFIADLESGRYDHLKDKPIVTYCTGGIRCEILTPIMKNRGFKEIYQIKGGIVRYGEKFKDGEDSLWEGSLYVFDKRMNMEFSDKAKTIGECEKCSAPTSQFYNCADLGCRDLILLCEGCAAKPENLACQDTHIRGRKQEFAG